MRTKYILAHVLFQLDADLNVLKSQKLWTDAAELSIMEARFYKKQDNHKPKKMTWMEEDE